MRGVGNHHHNARANVTLIPVEKRNRSVLYIYTYTRVPLVLYFQVYNSRSVFVGMFDLGFRLFAVLHSYTVMVVNSLHLELMADLWKLIRQKLAFS